MVLDQGLGEYVVIQDETGWIRAETRQTTPVGGENVVASGIADWDGNFMFLRETTFHPVAWDAMAEEKIVPAPGRPDELPTLTRSIEVRNLPASQAAWKYPVRIHGVVTTSRTEWKSLFVQDDTAGILVVLAEEAPPNLNVGDKVEVEGVSGPGGYAPVIEATNVRRLGKAKLPSPRAATLYPMAMGQFDSQWIEVRGVIRSAIVTSRYTRLEVSDPNGLVQLNVPGGDAFTNLVDSLVRVQGVCCSRPNPNRQLTGVYVWTPSTNLLVVEEAGEPDPFALHARPIASLSQFTQRRSVQHRVKIQGIITFNQPGHPLFVQDDTGGMPVYLAQADNFIPGDRVEVAGYLEPGDFGLVFRNASCLKVGRGPIPAPKPTTSLGILNQSLHGVWIETQARLIATARHGGDDALTLQAENGIAEAIRPGLDADSLSQLPAADSIVRVRGVYSIVGDESRRPKALRLYIPASEPITIVQSPPWLSGRRASVILPALAVAVLLAALWAISLRRRVGEQTLALRDRLEKEAVLQQRYRDIFDGASDIVLTHDLDGRLTSLNPAGLQALGYAPADVGQLTVQSILAPDSPSLDAGLAPAPGECADALVNHECEFVTRTGHRIPVETSTRLMMKDGKPVGVQAIARNIAERKKAQAALAEASALLQTLFDHSPDCIYFKDIESRYVRCSVAFARLTGHTDPATLIGKTDMDLFREEHAVNSLNDEREIIRTGEPIVGKLERETHLDGRVTWALSTKMPWRNESGRIVGTFGISKDISAIKAAESELAYERELFRTLLENFPDAIYFKDRESRFVRLSRSKVEKALLSARNLYRSQHPEAAPDTWPPHLHDVDSLRHYLLGKTDFETLEEPFAQNAQEEEQEIMRTGTPLISKLEHVVLPDKEERWILITKLPWRDKAGNVIGTFGVSRDVTELKQAEARLDSAHKRLIEISRLAGMAEVATDVLHNVGNVLNSINVSCSLTLERVRTSKITSFPKVLELLKQNHGRLAEFFTQDRRGRQLPNFLATLHEQLAEEQAEEIKELEHLVKHVDHVKQIVAMQQSYAKVAGVLENVSPHQLVEDALQINAAALQRHAVRVETDLENTPLITTEKHKVLQILVNLIRNAKYAMDEARRPDKQLTVRLASEPESGVRIQVIDNGIGIPPENLTRIFSHGFTTRQNGHGFGLHSSALAVRDLGGSLKAHSEGPGQGAIFTLMLPQSPPKTPQKPV